ncbi:MAG: TonB-dependent receptor, partial [Thiohalobacteraceae bacterium]
MKSILLASAAAGAVLLSTPAFAEDGATDASSGDIIVTARKVRERLQDVPVAVSAFTGRQLQERGAVQLGDVGSLSSGLTIRMNGSNATAVFLSLRGQVTNEVLATVEPSVGTYVDELYWSRAYGLNAALLDVADVQVLKGPQGTLFGRNTTGGAVLVSSNDPELDNFSGSADATYGRFNEATANVVLNVPVSQQIAVRGAFHISRRDGWSPSVRQYNLTTGLPDNSYLAPGQGEIRPDGRKFRDLDELQGRAKMLWQVSDATKIILSGEWFNSRTTPSRQLLYKVNLNDSSSAGDNVSANTAALAYLEYFRTHPLASGADAFDCNYSPSATNCNDVLRPFDHIEDKTTSQTYIAKLVSDTSFGQLKVIGGYRQVDATTVFDVDGSSALLHTTTLEQDLKSWSGEVQLTGKTLEDRLSYAVGATYFGEKGYDLSYSMSTRPGGVRRNNATRNYGYIDNESIGFYSQLTYALTDSLNLTGGLRWSQDKKGIEIRSANVGLDGELLPFVPNHAFLGNPCNAVGSTNAPTMDAPDMRFDYITGATAANDCAAYRSDTFSALSWTAGLDYKINRDVLVYAKASRGYRAGGQNMRAFNDYQFVPFKPETLTEFELGLKAELLDRMVRFNFAAYRNTLNDAQRNVNEVTNGISNTLIKNAAKVRNTGFEADLTVRPMPGLTLGASGAYNDAKYLNYADDNGTLNHTRFVLVPEYTLNFSGTYTTQINDSTSLTFNTEYSVTGRMNNDACTVTYDAGAGQANTMCWKGGADSTGRTALEISQDIYDASILPASGILNARITLGLQNDAYTISLWGRNLTNVNTRMGSTVLMAPYRNYVSGTIR